MADISGGMEGFAPAPDGARVRTAVAGVKRWYHCIEVAPGVATPGLFDLRPVLDRLPWPDVRGRRCLDVGTADGYFAFELERRGAAEVVAIDLAAHEGWDWEQHIGDGGVRYLRHVAGPEPGAGFRVAHELRGSSVRFQALSVYDLGPQALGEFDVVVCGSLLLHLRDPLRALAGIRSVCAGQFLSTSQVDLRRSVWAPRSPLIRLDGTSGITQWWLPNAAGHRQMLRAAGFDIERQSRLYSIPYGPAHPVPPRRPRWLLRSAVRLGVTGNDGVAHHAILARPRQWTAAGPEGLA
jgi:tRNA (mo5U34)-methyltransferase